MRLSPRYSIASLLVLGSLIASHAQASDWQMYTSMPAPKANTLAVKYNGLIYMVGGAPWVNGNDQDGSVYKLNANGTWTTAFPLEGMGPVSGQGGGVDANNHIIVFGGVATNGDISPGRSYEPVDGPIDWITDASINAPPLNFGYAVDGQKRIYRLGGGCDDCFLNYGYCTRYNGVTDSWEQIAYLPYSRSSIAAAYDGQGHIWGFGGYTSFGLPRIHDTIKYTIATNTWESIGMAYVPIETSDAKAVLGADGNIYLIGGLAGAYTGLPTTNVWILEPGSNTPILSVGPALNVARYDFGAVLGDDNYIYVIGGMGANGALSSVERLYTGACPAVPNQSPSQSVSIGQTVNLTATATGGAPLTFQWERNGQPLSNGPTGHGSTIAGATTTALTITNFAATDVGTYTLTATNPCSSATSDDIVLSTSNPADINHDGHVDASDLAVLLGAWGTSSPASDLNGDGTVNAADLAILLGAWG